MKIEVGLVLFAPCPLMLRAHRLALLWVFCWVIDKFCVCRWFRVLHALQLPYPVPLLP